MKAAQILGFVFGMILAGAGCLSLRPQPPVDLSGPDWTIRNGQAVWVPEAGATELAGELMVASHPDGTCVVQFAKPPLPLVNAQQNSTSWEAQFFAQKKRYSGRGKPPARLVWLQLPLALEGQPLANGWSVRRDGPERWRLENVATHESLEGFLTTTKRPQR